MNLYDHYCHQCDKRFPADSFEAKHVKLKIKFVNIHAKPNALMESVTEIHTTYGRSVPTD